MKAWGKSGESTDGYIKVTDILTNYVDTWTANVAGDYLAWVDMNSCTIINKHYVKWSDNSQNSALLNNKWNPAAGDPTAKNVIGVELGVGPSDLETPTMTQTSYAPWISISVLGFGVDPAYGNGRFHFFSVVLTGK